ncbi:uncharacterized protein LOC141590259 [Silene latifolia]|uniref:uncharacterized protein LOC141590259 n=1 Tax=Silene latifolia TaxID=37657 RepID=UPI003D76CE82
MVIGTPTPVVNVAPQAVQSESPVIAPAAELTATPEEVQHQIQVVWNKDGTYGQVNTPLRPVVSLSRTAIIRAGQQSSKLSQYTFLDAMNNATPKVGIGTKGLFGLLETKVKPKSLNHVHMNICDGWSITTNTTYQPGGKVWVLWNPQKFKVQFLFYSAQMIHMKVTDSSLNFDFYCSMIYAFNDLNERKSLWQDLNQLSTQCQGPWVLCGDFNCVLSPTERLGGQTSNEEMEDFQNCIDQCGLIDSPAAGSLYTWTNKQDPSTRVYSRLDRVLVNQDWLTGRRDYFAQFYNEGLLDHTPCIIQDSTSALNGRKSFKYFTMWSQVGNFLPCVQHHWHVSYQGTKMYQVVKKLKSLKKPLRALNKELFADIENNAIHAWKHLDSLQTSLKQNPTNPCLILQEIEAAKVYRELQQAADSFLLQKSKATWVNLGDDNTGYFHKILKGRYTRNKVLKNVDMDG